MSQLWQTIIIVVALVGASAYLLRSWLNRRKQGSCPDCQVHKLAKARVDRSKILSRRS